MTSEQAFKKVTAQRGWYKALNIEEGTANSWVNRFKKGALSEEKVDEVLHLAGYELRQQKDWGKPGEEPTSSIEKLVDMPPEYFDTISEWIELHNHMFSADLQYIEKVKMYDVYIQKLKAMGKSKAGESYSNESGVHDIIKVQSIKTL